MRAWVLATHVVTRDYEVKSASRSIDMLSARGCRQVSPATPAVLFEGRKVAFLLGTIGLLELLEA